MSKLLGYEFIMEYKRSVNKVTEALSRKEAEKNDPKYLALISIPTLELLSQVKKVFGIVSQ